MRFLRLTTAPRRQRLLAGALALSLAAPFAVTFDRVGTDAATPARPAAVAQTQVPSAVSTDTRPDLPSGWIETFAGQRIEGALAANVSLDVFAQGFRDLFVTEDDGSIVFAARNQIHRVTLDGVIERVAGTGIPLDFGDGGPALAAGFVDIRRLDLDANGDIVVTEITPIESLDVGMPPIRFRRISVGGTVTSVANVNRLACPTVLVPGRTCVVKDARRGGDGSIYLQLAVLGPPGFAGIPLDDINLLAVLRHPGTDALPTILAGNGPGDCTTTGVDRPSRISVCGFDVAPTDAGELYLLQTPLHRIAKVSRNGTLSFVEASSNPGFSAPTETFLPSQARSLQWVRATGALLYAGDPYGTCCTITRVFDEGLQSVAGFGGNTGEFVSALTSIATDAFAVASDGEHLTELVRIGRTQATVFRSVGPDGLVMTATGTTKPDGPVLGRAATVCNPTCAPWGDSIAIGPNDDLFVRNGEHIIRLDAAGGVRPFESSAVAASSTFATAPDGTLYFVADREFQSETPFSFAITTVHPDGRAETHAVGSAMLKGAALAADDEGHLYSVLDGRIVRYALVDDVYQIEAQVAGNGGTCVGPLARCAGKDGQSAREVPLFSPRGLAVDDRGSLYVAEFGGSQVRRIDPDGTIHRIAGTGEYGSDGDGGPAVRARLGRPLDVAIGPDGSVYIADFNGSRVRKVDPAGLITTMAGDGTYTASLDRAPALNPVFTGPARVAVDSKGYVYVFDVGTATVRRVAPGRAAETLPTGISSTSRFVAVPPTRILDTRENLGAKGPVAKAGTIDLMVTGAHGDVTVPADATAVVMNVTVTDATAPGFVQVFPKDGATIGASSNLNVERPGQTLPNLVTARVGAQGKLSLYTQGGGQLVGDLVGYFSPEITSGDGRYVALAPARVLDTREGLGQVSARKPAAGESVKLAVLGRGGAPAGGVSAVAMNVTITEATAPGFVQVIPTGGPTAIGTSSNLNASAAGQTIPNLVIVPVGADGSVTLYTQSGGHLLADMAGYFTDESAVASTTGLFVPTSPTRLLDTRDNGGARPAAGATVEVKAIEVAPPELEMRAGNVSAIFTNLTATESAAPGFVQGLPTHQADVGSSSNLNLERRDQTIANAAVVTLGDGDAFTLYTQNGTHLVADMAGYFLK